MQGRISEGETYSESRSVKVSLSLQVLAYSSVHVCEEMSGVWERHHLKGAEGIILGIYKGLRIEHVPTKLENLTIHRVSCNQNGKPTYPSSTSPRHKKEKTPPWYIIIKLFKTSNEEKILEVGREKRYIMTEEQRLKMTKLFTRNNENQKMEQHL